jgi:hypothetical protein
LRSPPFKKTVESLGRPRKNAEGSGVHLSAPRRA